MTISSASQPLETATAPLACPICGECAWGPAWPPTCLRPCRRCGAVLNDRSRSRREEEALYTAHPAAPPADQEAISRARWRWVRARFPATDLRPVRVLDVGCGYGGFLAAVVAEQTERWGSPPRVAGIELDPAAAAECRRLGLPVIAGSLFDIGVPAGPWDVITLWDVLDHMEDPRAALQMLAATLAPGGLIVIRARNAALHVPLKVFYKRHAPLARRLGIPDLGCVHRWGFTPSHYRRMLAEVGLEAVRAHPGVPSPGDRDRVLRHRALVLALKAVAGAVGGALHRISLGRAYPYLTVLITGRRPVPSLED